MNIRQLEYFIAVAKNLNFTEASKQLFVAQSAISHQIKELEVEIGIQLFVRNKRSVTLTAAGKVFLEQAQQILNDTNYAIKIARQASEGFIGDLNIGFLNHSVDLLLPNTVKIFKQKFEEVNINIQHLTLREMQEKLRNHSIDLAFTTCFGIESIPNVQMRKIYDCHSKLVVPTNHPLAQNENVLLKGLSEETFFTVNKEHSLDAYNRVISLCRKGNYYPKTIREETDIDTILLLISCGLGVSILPTSLELQRKQTNKNVKFLEISNVDSSFHIVAAWLLSNNNPIIPHFIEELIIAKQNN